MVKWGLRWSGAAAPACERGAVGASFLSSPPPFTQRHSKDDNHNRATHTKQHSKHRNCCTYNQNTSGTCKHAQARDARIHTRIKRACTRVQTYPRHEAHAPACSSTHQHAMLLIFSPSFCLFAVLRYIYGHESILPSNVLARQLLCVGGHTTTHNGTHAHGNHHALCMCQKRRSRKGEGERG